MRFSLSLVNLLAVKLLAASCELQAASCELRVASCELDRSCNKIF